jgi:hypothetical protein
MNVTIQISQKIHVPSGDIVTGLRLSLKASLPWREQTDIAIWNQDTMVIPTVGKFHASEVKYSSISTTTCCPALSRLFNSPDVPYVMKRIFSEDQVPIEHPVAECYQRNFAVIVHNWCFTFHPTWISEKTGGF